MSYSQKIKNLLQKMKEKKNYNKYNQKKKINIPKNGEINKDYANNIPLINEENYLNNRKKISFKNNKNIYLISNDKNYNDSNIQYIKLSDKNYLSNRKIKFNNNFIIETSYDKYKSKINDNNNINNKNININNSSKNNSSSITWNNQSNNYINYNKKDEKKLLLNKINHFNSDNKNISIISTSYHKIKRFNNSEDEIHNNKNRINNNVVYFSGMNSNKNKTKNKISSYILKDINNDSKIVSAYNTSPIEYSSIYIKNSQKRFSNESQVKDNYNNIINRNNNIKNINSRIVKRHPFKSISELFIEDKNENIYANLTDRTKSKIIKKKLLISDKDFNNQYDNDDEEKNNILKILKRNFNSSSNLRESDNHSGGKIILTMSRNSLKRKSRRKMKNDAHYAIKIQSFWRGYMLRKLIKITKELLLLFNPFINKIQKHFNNCKKKYYLYFIGNIKQYILNKSSNNKNILSNDNKIKYNKILYNKHNNNIKSEKFMKKTISSAALLNTKNGLKKNININDIKNSNKMNDIREIKIDNIFYHKKKLSFNKTENDSKTAINEDKTKMKNLNRKNNFNYNLSNKRFFKKSSIKKFYNVSPDFRNIELNIKNPLKHNIYEHTNNNLNNYSSSISIFFQTQFPENKVNSLKNLVYINKNKKPKYNIKSDIFEKIKIKIFKNFYLTLYKCLKKSAYRFYWNKLLLKLKKSKTNILYNVQKTNILKVIINKISNKIEKYYFRKYRENILVEKIKSKIFYLTDYSRANNTVFNSKQKNILKNYTNRLQPLLNIYQKYNKKFLMKNFFSKWKMKIHYNFIQIEYPLSTTRNYFSKHS